jgi:hypothetical protein
MPRKTRKTEPDSPANVLDFAPSDAGADQATTETTTTPEHWTEAEENGKAVFVRADGLARVFCPNTKWVVEVGDEILQRRYFSTPAGAIEAANRALAKSEVLDPSAEPVSLRGDAKPKRAKVTSSIVAADRDDQGRVPPVTPEIDPDFASLTGWTVAESEIVGPAGKLVMVGNSRWQGYDVKGSKVGGVYRYPSRAARCVERAA